MGVRMLSVSRWVAQFVVVCTAVGFVGIGEGSANELMIHPGQIIERHTQSPLAARAVAWDEHEETGRTGSCPKYGNAVDADMSDATSGEFEVRIPESQSLYAMVYCANGYHSRVDRFIRNEENNTPVIPTPAELNRVAKKDEDIVDQREWVGSFTVDFVAYTLNELAYLYSIDGEAFRDGIENYREEMKKQDQEGAAESLEDLLRAVTKWAGID